MMLATKCKASCPIEQKRIEAVGGAAINSEEARADAPYDPQQVQAMFRKFRIDREYSKTDRIRILRS